MVLRSAVATADIQSFNPFIQVFYFYENTELIEEEFGGELRFNPFIQVFYFYSD